MSVQITGRYNGNKRVTLTHDLSQTEIITDAPKDNAGEGRSFSPTDLCAASLGSCMLTIIAIFVERDGIKLSGAHFKVVKEMSAQPRRIGKITVEMHLPSALTNEQRTKVERVAKDCPVHHSLHPDVMVVVGFLYDVG